MKKKTFLKAIAMIMSLVTLASASLLAGCGTEVIEKVDETKTTLKVFNYDAGFGSSWIENIKKEFEEAYKDVSFADGKKGVQVMLQLDRAADIDQLLESGNHIIFHDIKKLLTYSANGQLVDISEAVTSVNTDGKTIESKMTEGQKSYLSQFGGKYYAIPHYESINGLSYDVELFDEYNLYFGHGAENSDSDGFILSPTSEKSCGPDGKVGTYDDGLPATHDEIKKLFDKMLNSSTKITPMIWSGTSREEYVSQFLSHTYKALAGDSVIYGETLNSNGKEIKLIESFDSEGNPVITSSTITPETGYKLSMDANKYYTYELLDWILGDGNGKYYVSDVCEGSYSMTEAQKYYVYSAPEGSPVGIFMDGSWWYNEAEAALKACAEEYPSYAQRKFAPFPMPRHVHGTNADVEALGLDTEAYTVLNGQPGYAIACAKTVTDDETYKAVIEFLKFCFTDEKLAQFTSDVYTTRALKYEMSDEQLEKLPYYVQALWNYKKLAMENGKYHSGGYAGDWYKMNYGEVSIAGGYLWNSKVGASSYNSPMNPFLTTITAKQYYLGSLISKATWEQTNASLLSK
ncbi:MAG: hypothetical protein E7346_03940 [Clostridiales bacterium]|nr:hypothetical protein [Clostridiales bacterium]